MKKLNKIIAIILLPIILFNFVSCNEFNIKNTDDLIISPYNKSNYLSGVWKVKSAKIIDSNLANQKTDTQLMKVSISFSDTMAIIGDNTLMNPKTKLKVYYSKHYLLYQYNINVEQLNIDKDKPINVISVYENNNMFCEAILTSSKEGYIYQNGVIYQVYKISDMADKLPEISKRDVAEGMKPEGKAYSYDSATGVLISLKSDRTKTDNEKYDENRYRTLWISFNGKLNPIYQRDDIFMPRLKGFSILNVRDANYYSNSSKVNEYITIDSLNMNNGIEKETTKRSSYDDIANENIKSNMEEQNKLVDLLFISNDYFSAQYYLGNDFSGSYPTLKTLPVDNPNNKVGLYVGALGKEATKSYNSAVDALKNKTGEAYKANTQSFGMIRQNGYWGLKGRASIEDEFSEFNLNILPGKKLITYDKLYVSWQAIKDRVPYALDAVTSPTARIAVVRTKTKLLIYNIKNGELDREPLRQVTLNNNEEIIMAEWANNEFVDSWTKAFKSYGDYKEVK